MSPTPTTDGASSRVVAALGAVHAALESVAADDVTRLTSEQVVQSLGAAASLGRRLQALALTLAGEVDARGLAEGAGATSTVALVRTTLQMRGRDASRYVRLAVALRERYRVAATALAAGAMSVEHAEVIRDCLHGLPSAVAPDQRLEGEHRLVAEAARFDPGALLRIGQRLHLALDPDGLAALERAERRRAAGRELWLTPEADGSLRLRGRLDAEGAGWLLAALGPLAAPRPSAADGADLRSAAQRRADALTDLARLAASVDDMPTNGGVRPTLVVTIDWGALRSKVSAGLLDSDVMLSAGEVRRLACDAQIVPVVLGSAGVPLDVGRSSRTVPTGMHRALVARDRGCVFPGCDRPPGWCHAHHIEHWADGGSTSLANLALLCAAHHGLVHRDLGWTLTMGADARPSVTGPRWALAA
jgi:hypothetical protein